MASKGAGAKKVKDKEITDEVVASLTSLSPKERKALRENLTLEDIYLEVKLPGYKSELQNLDDRLPFHILQRAYDTITSTYEIAKERFEEREAARAAKREALIQKETERLQKELNDKEIKEMGLEPFDPFNEGTKTGAPYFKGPDNKVYTRFPNNFYGDEIGVWNPETEELELFGEEDLRPDELAELRKESERLRKESLAKFNPYITEEEQAQQAAAAAKMVGAAPKLADKDKEEEDDAIELRRFTLNGTRYLRTAQNEIWLEGPGGSMGAWQGIYNPARNRIEPAPEPEF